MGLYLEKPLAFSPIKSNDVVSRTAKLQNFSSAGSASKVVGPTVNAVTFVVRKGDTYQFTYFDTDAAGNVSPDAPVYQFVATDTIAPAQPDIATDGGPVVETDATPDC